MAVAVQRTCLIEDGIGCGERGRIGGHGGRVAGLRGGVNSPNAGR
jgi:hypothetical protein